MNFGGWICLHRKIQESWLWELKPFSKGQAWIDLLINANFEDKKALIAGQFENIPISTGKG